MKTLLLVLALSFVVVGTHHSCHCSGGVFLRESCRHTTIQSGFYGDDEFKCGCDECLCRGHARKVERMRSKANQKHLAETRSVGGCDKHKRKKAVNSTRCDACLMILTESARYITWY